jgi:hypothetical protein
MPRNKFHHTKLPLTLFLLFIWTYFASPSTVGLAQEPTPTTAPQPGGMYITVITEEPQINVRMGPSSSIYPVVGTLARGETVPALGRSAGGDWVQIEFPGAPNNKGWVYSPLVSVSAPGILQIVEPPPTPVPPPTATIDPTLAAQFSIAPTSTRLPTFTPPPSMTMPVYTQAIPPTRQSPVSVGIIIIVLGTLGILGFVTSLFINRR